jgi:hypothetical protein
MEVNTEVNTEVVPVGHGRTVSTVHLRPVQSQGCPVQFGPGMQTNHGVTN